MKAKHLNIPDDELDVYHNKARSVISDFITEECGYSKNFIQYYYNNVILPQLIVDDVLKRHRDEIIHIVVPGLSLRIYLRDNTRFSGSDSAKGYTYSIEPII